MRTRVFWHVLWLMVMVSCSDEQLPENSHRSPIRLSVMSAGDVSSRAHLYEGTASVVAEQEFALDAFLIDGSDSPYLENRWVFYNAKTWRFRDETYTGKLLDYYWPNRYPVNFVAYMPYQLSKSFVKREDVRFSNNGGLAFDCTLPGTDGGGYRTINDTDDGQRAAENGIHEFVYALRKDCQKGITDKDPVKLCFVHPFAAIKFNLSQSHRDLTIHSITLNGVYNVATYANANDTYDTYLNDQSSLTYETWSGTNTSILTVNYEKTVPGQINYYSLIGGPYLVIPQSLEGVTLSVNYTWDENTDYKTTPVSLKTTDITAWQPGMIYTYTLDLGDNKEEILFKATVEPWTKGEDDGYENEYEVI